MASLRALILGAVLVGCLKPLPPENYSITITIHTCDDAGVCGTTTETIAPIHDQPDANVNEVMR